jgi:3-oxoacyl-[acyl-carrier protein] reductase
MVGIDLAGRVALVTGGSRGLGRAAALALARADADVAVHYRRDARAAVDVAMQCEQLGVRALAIKADVASPADVKRLFGAAELELGRLDILVASAGIWKSAAIEKMTDRQLSEMLDINVKGVFACCREAVPLMRKAGGGRIILMASTAGQRGEAFHSHYAASKGAVISLTKSLAPELAADHILVNCIAPGWFDTDMSRPSLGKPEAREQVVATIPLGRVGRPEEFAGAVLFLASEMSTFVTGEILNVNGGAVLVG